MGHGFKMKNNEINTHFLISEIFAGDANKALDVARRYPRTNFTLTAKSIERFLILKRIEGYVIAGEDVDIHKIIEEFSTEDNKIERVRVERIKEDYLNGKYD